MLNLLVEPVPVSAAVIWACCCAIVIEMLPFCSPADFGLKSTVSFIVSPVVSIFEPEKPVTLNPFPVAETFVSVTYFPPRLLTITVWLALDPIPTLPKLIALGVITSLPFATSSFGFAEDATHVEAPHNPKHASTMTIDLASRAARVAKSIKFDGAPADMKTRFISRCILREGTCRKLLARGTRGRTGGTPVR